jgi:predicted benzoate:H+ symporter BenE
VQVGPGQAGAERLATVRARALVQQRPWSVLSIDAAVVWAALTAFCWYAFALIPIQLATASALGLDHTGASSLVFIIWSTAGVGTLAFALTTRQPIALSSQFPVLIYLASLSEQFTLPQLMGGLLVSGLAVTIIGWLGLAARVLHWIPASIAMAVFVGSVFGVLGHVVDACRMDPMVGGAAVGGYLLGASWAGGSSRRLAWRRSAERSVPRWAVESRPRWSNGRWQLPDWLPSS